MAKWIHIPFFEDDSFLNYYWLSHWAPTTNIILHKRSFTIKYIYKHSAIFTVRMYAISFDWVFRSENKLRRRLSFNNIFIKKVISLIFYRSVSNEISTMIFTVFFGKEGSFSSKWLIRRIIIRSLLRLQMSIFCLLLRWSV